MKIDNCQYDLETKLVSACDNCRISRFQTHQAVKFGVFKLIITKVYETKTCFMGFAPGDLVNVFSLLPKEEQELEIIRRSKYTSALHEERSVESEFETEFQNTLRVELGASQDFNASESAGGGFDLFGLLEADASASATQHLHFDQKLFNETIVKAGLKVSNKYDVSIDTKTEAENQFRSLRKISNPNPCRVVTFFFKQLNKKYKITVSLVDVRYDVIIDLPHPFRAPWPYYIKNLASAASEIHPVRVTEASAIARMDTAMPKAAMFSVVAHNTPQLEVYPVNAKVQYKPIEQLPFKQLSAAAIADKATVMNLSAKDKTELQAYLKKIQVSPEYKPGIIYTSEFCLRTNNVVAEPKVSECSICDCNEVGCGCKEKEGE